MVYVEYIQNGTGSTNTSGWNILLGYTPSNTTNVMMRTKITTDNNYFEGDCLIGAKGGRGNFFRFFGYQSNRMTFDCPNDSSGRITTYYTGTTEWEVSFINGDLTLKNITANLTTTAHTDNTVTFNQEWSVWLNSVRESTQIYYIEIYENGVKVKDYRPAKDNSNVVCLYETIGGTYHYSTDKALIAGPNLSSIVATPSKTILAATGETINIVVDCENAWTLTTSGESFLTLSSTGDTGSTTITATAPSYSGTTNRETTITFLDTTTNDTAVITIKQKKYISGQPVYLGGNEVTELYLGETAIAEAYLGENLVYSSGPFTGLKLTPSSLSFTSGSLSKTLKVKASESWTMTVPEWITASSLTGDTGTTEIILTTTAQQAATAGTISVTSANYSASASCAYSTIRFVEYLTTDAKCWFDTGIIPDFDTKIEVSLIPLDWQSFDIPEKGFNGFVGAQNTDDGNSTFQIRNYSSNTRWAARVGNGASNVGPNYTRGTQYTLTLDKNNLNVDGTDYGTGASSMDTCNYTLFISAINNGETSSSWQYHRAAAATFYYVKVWKNDVLVGDFRPSLGENDAVCFYDEVSQTCIYNLGTGTPVAGPDLS